MAGKKGKKKKVAAGDVATNRQASFKYELLDKYEAGLVLQGSEAKALRDGQAQIKDGYVVIKDGEAWLHSVYIPPYAPAAGDNHEPERTRKLLLHRNEIEKLITKMDERGFTLVPTRIYFKDGRAKLEVALARGKNQGDKRETLKRKEQDREMQREMSKNWR